MSDPTVNKLRIRVMEPTDLTAVAMLEAKAKPDPWSLALFAGEFDVSPQARHWLVAELNVNTDDAGDSKGTDLVGFAGAMFVADEAHVLNIVVDPGSQGRGIGRVLLSQLLLDAVDRGAVSATLEVRSDNQAALALYSNVGFEKSGTRPRYYADGADAAILWMHRLYRPERSAHLAGLARIAGTTDRNQR